MRATERWHKSRAPQALPDGARFGYAQLPGYSAEYMTVGDGEPIVLVPGLAGGYGLLGRLAGLLARDFRVVSYELRGERDPWQGAQGQSLATLADDLAGLLDFLQLERPNVLAVSFGSAVALEFASAYPGSLGSLVLQGADTRFRPRLIKAVATELLSRVELPHDNPFFNQFFRLLFGRMEEPGPLFDFVTQRCWGTDQAVMAQRLAMLEHFDVESRLEQVRAPTLVVAAEHDVFASAEGHRLLSERIPEADLVTIPRAGHLAFLTRPKALARMAKEFLLHARVAGA